MAINQDNIKKYNIPKVPGCYFYYDRTGKIIYIGKSADLRTRVLSYWRNSSQHTPAKFSMLKRIEWVEWVETDSEIEALLLEANLIKKHQPEYNVSLRDDKRFVYVKISTEDEIPGVFMTRKVDHSGRYFGPFVSVQAVRDTLKALRKIWPYCTERTLKLKPCFYFQIERCTGVCGGRFDIKEYRRQVISPIILFFEGRKDRVVKEMVKESLALLKAGRDEEAAKIKYRLNNMKHVLEHTNVLSVSEKYAADVVELAKILGLNNIPARIEGYDISNIFGEAAVGSMVVFRDGEPDKNGYRKFKIRIGQGEASDTRMLKEVLTRRFDNDWPSPDLIIVDGAKAQLNAILSIIKKGHSEIPVIAISKGEGLRSSTAPDRLYFPGEKKPLELPLSSPALHIVKRVRDEAHRFAISYHRKLKKKAMFK